MAARSIYGFLAVLALVGWVAGCTSGSADSAGPNGGSTAASADKNGTEKEKDSGAQTGEPAAKPPQRPNLTLGGVPPADNDALLVYYADDPDTLNLITSNDTQSTAWQNMVYESLARQRMDDPDVWEPELAESWEFDEKTLTYTIRLRKGVYWHPITLPNGKELPRTEFTARDVTFTFDCILNPNIEAAALRSYYENPKATSDADKFKIKVTRVDKYTVKFQWTEPYFLAKDFTLGIGIMPRHVYSVDENGEPISLDFRNSPDFAKAFNNHWANSTMCGTGPLIFKRWEREQEVVLVRNPDYWGNPFFFTQVVYRNISNPNTALEQILQNELDWGAIPQKDHFIQSQTRPEVTSGKVALEKFTYPAYRYLGFNQRRELFKDKRVRWAFSHAIPIEEIIEKIYFNLAERLTGPFLPGSTGYDSSLEPIPYDLDKARQLLDEAGWVDSDGDGVRDKQIAGTKVNAICDLIIYADSPQYRAIAEIIKENARRIGVEVQITPTQWALMLQKLRKKEFDACILGWAMNWKTDPYQIWHSSQADLEDSSNSIGYKNEEVDRLIEELRVTLDEPRQVEIYKQIHRIIYDEQPYTFLFMDKATAGRHARLQNVKFYKIRPSVNSREWYSSVPRPLAQ